MRNIELAMRTEPRSIHEANAMSQYGTSPPQSTPKPEFGRAALTALRDTRPNAQCRHVASAARRL